MAQATGALPNLIVIGAQKCGTSALHYYLDLHPKVSMSAPKELNYFLGDFQPLHGPGAYEPLEAKLVARGEPSTASRGIDWYRAQFDPDAAIRGEASPNYTAPWYPSLAGRMHEVVPGARLIFCVRDPLEQIVSAWMHYRAGGNEPRPFGEAVDDSHGMYVSRARYHERLSPFIEAYGLERILVLEQRDLLERRRETMSRVFGFLGVEDHWDERMERERHATATKNRRARALRWMQFYSPLRGLVRVLPQEAKWRIERAVAIGTKGSERPEMSNELRERLGGWLVDDVARLRAVAGEEFAGWSL